MDVSAYFRSYKYIFKQIFATKTQAKHDHNLTITFPDKHRISQAKAIKLFIKALKERPLVLEEWDSSCWTLFVDKAIVHKDKSITFRFNNGTNIKIEVLN